MTKARLLIIGAGNMAEAIARGALAAGAPVEFIVCDTESARRALFERPEFAAVVRSVHERVVDGAAALAPGDQILLAVKPQALPEVARELAPAMGGERRVVVSILAGAPSARIRALLGGCAAVVRVMPNIPARIRQGVAAVALGDGARPGDEALAVQLFEACGEVVRINESLMDAVTALAGSGPAYVFYLAEAMTRAAVEMGFDPSTADAVVRQVVAGSGALLKGAAQTPQELRRAVTSKGGTTAAAIDTLDAAGAMDAIVRAIIAARDRGADLARAQPPSQPPSRP